MQAPWRSGQLTGTTEPHLAAMPAAYRAWRASDLGRITDRLEEELVTAQVGPVHGRTVLDAGCGDAVLGVALAKSGAGVTGLDRDAGMLAMARRRAVHGEVALALVQGDVASLPFADNSFDVIVAVTVLCFVPDANGVLAEFARVLRPGGRLVIGELGRHSLWAAKRRVAGWLGHPVWRAASFRSASDLERLASKAGFSVRETRGAVFYPPCDACARRLACLDRVLAPVTTFGAAFIALSAGKPVPTV
jgi:SAM-dependent methyltransferase